MKKIMFLALAALFGMSINANAAVVKYSAGGLNYSIDNATKKATVTGITTGASVPATLTIGASITPTGDDVTDVLIKNEECAIVAIGPAAFKNKTAITKVELPASVITIGANAFEGLTGLTVANFTWAPKAASTIGDEAFKGCTKFAGAYALPKWVATIGNGAFENTGLTALTLATNAQLATVGGEFISGTAIEEIDFTKASDITFADNAFASDKLKKVIFAAEFDEDSGLPSVECGITTDAANKISALMFSGAYALEEVVFPSTLTTIAAGAFATSTALKGLDLSYTKVVAIEDLFQANKDFPRTAFTSIKFSTTATGANIKENAFAYCTGLTTVTFPDNWATTSIVKNNAFLGCTGLTSVTFLGAVAADSYTAGTYAGILEFNAFTGCKTGMAKVNMNVKSAYYTNVGGGTAANVPTCIAYVKTDEEAAAEDTWTISFATGSNNQAFKCHTLKDWSVKASDAVVYSVYVDQSTYATDATDGYDGTIYIFPHKVDKGEYKVEQNEAVIIKSKGESTVTASLFAPTTLTSTAVVTNELVVNLTPNASINTILSDAATPNRTLWQGNIQNGVLGFAKPSTSTLAKGTYYVISKKGYSASGRMNVVWVDENDATAIQAIQNKVKSSNNAIYNLRGEKVNAAYKGLVIKNGKKYIQK
jgi:hypothetical protein